MRNIPPLPLRIVPTMEHYDGEYSITDNDDNILFKDGNFNDFPSNKEFAEFIVESCNYASGFKALVEGWKKDAKHYESGLRKVREFARGKNQEIASMIDDILSWENKNG